MRVHVSCDMIRVFCRMILLVYICSLVSRSGSVLLYPKNTVFQLTIGVSVPVSMNKRGSIAFTYGFQFNYKLPSDISDFEPTIISARNIRDLDLQDTYTAIESFLDGHGWKDGRECLLRTICELAEIPLGRTRQDILEETIHLILTPTEDLPGTFNSSYRSVDELYHEAERFGKSGGDCTMAYPRCIESPLESFTNIGFP